MTMTMQTFYFNTGVNAYLYPAKPKFGQVNRGGTVQIPFECHDVPEGSTFKFACDNPELENNNPRTIVREINPGSGLYSKYAYFSV